jgi:diphthamide synthase (EF-2-diphthine--ammonia ligase)
MNTPITAGPHESRCAARAVGLPLLVAPLPFPCSNEAYESAMTAALGEARTLGIEALAFGDRFLEDVRAYREQRMQATGMATLFPLWGEPTDRLAAEMIDAGVGGEAARGQGGEVRSN